MTGYAQALREAFAPEAIEYLEGLNDPKRIVTTQDSYGTVMGFLAKLPDTDVQSGFLAALIDAGYPRDTGNQLASIMGFSLDLA